jgi:hypothetical protein
MKDEGPQRRVLMQSSKEYVTAKNDGLEKKSITKEHLRVHAAWGNDERCGAACCTCPRPPPRYASD